MSSNNLSQDLQAIEEDFELEAPKATPKIEASKLQAKLEKMDNAGNLRGGKGITGVQFSEAEYQELDEQVSHFIKNITDSNIDQEVFNVRKKGIHSLGQSDIVAAAEVSNKLLDKPLKRMKEESAEGNMLAKALGDLRNVVEELDPSKRLSTKNKLLSMLPFGIGDKTKNYFREFESAQGTINSIVESIINGKQMIENDNELLEEEKAVLWERMKNLEKWVYITKRIDAALVQRITEVEAVNPERARVLKDEVLFYNRQKTTDLLQTLAVSMQGYITYDTIRKTNLELIKGADRALTTTRAALNIAVTAAMALTNQKIVLEQITAFNTITGNLIENTARMLETQAPEVYKLATEATIDLEVLQRSFTSIQNAVNSISNYKIQALDNMQNVVTNLTEEVDKTKKLLDRVRSEETKEALKDLDLDGPTTSRFKI